MNVLLWGLPQDAPLAAIHRELHRAGVAPLMVDQRRPDQAAIELMTSATVTGMLRLPGRAVAIEEIGAAYLRPYDARRLHSPTNVHAAAVAEALISWASVTPALVVNRPAAMASNESKPYQLELIRAAGFAVPPTLVTTDPAAVRELAEKHGPVIYKSVSGVRSRVARLSSERAQSLDDVAWCPTQLQRHIDGVDHRVHVVKDLVFATRVESADDDYRYADRPPILTETTLPPEIERRTIDLAAALELPLAGIDLRVTPEGEWFCFEVNPSPAFTYYESATGQPIAAAIARLLAGAG
jgi:glutathione synthase/RimK-type ligase-like ATP-grasp enzyme